MTSTDDTWETELRNKNKNTILTGRAIRHVLRQMASKSELEIKALKLCSNYLGGPWKDEDKFKGKFCDKNALTLEKENLKDIFLHDVIGAMSNGRVGNSFLYTHHFEICDMFLAGGTGGFGD